MVLVKTKIAFPLLDKKGIYPTAIILNPIDIIKHMLHLDSIKLVCLL